MTEVQEFRVYFTQTEDGSWLAASVAAPWFCLSAPSEEEVRGKAERALCFWAEHRNARISQNLERAVTPFAPQRVESIRPAELCA